MAATRKRSKRGGSRRSRKGARTQARYVGEGVQAVLGWAGSAVSAFWNGLRWLAVGAWDLLQGHRGRQPFGMVLAAFSVFAFVALLDYRKDQPNICGVLGYNLAEGLLVFLGFAAFLAPGFGVFWGVARLVRDQEGGHAVVKVLGVAFLSVATALLAHWMGDPTPTNAFPHGHGGWLAEATFPKLLSGLGPFGLGVMLGLLALLSLLMATEWAFVPLVLSLVRRGRDRLQQQELPWGRGRRARVAAAGDDGGRARKADGGRSPWQALVGLFRSYEKDEDEGAARPADDEKKEPFRMTVAGREVDPAAAAAVAQAEGDPEREAEPALGVAAEADEDADVDEEDEDDEWEYVEEDGDDEGWEDEEDDEEGWEDEEDDADGLPGISAGSEEKSARLERDDEPSPRPRRRKPRLDSLPTADLLTAGENTSVAGQREEVNELGQKLQAVFDAFDLNCKVIGAERGPTLTMFEVRLASGVSVKKLKNQIDDMGVALGTHSVRIVHPLPGRTTVGVEVPNMRREAVRLRDVFDDAEEDFRAAKLPMVLGRDTLGKKAVEDLAEMPHMLIAGTTGSGKSVCLNSILVSLLLTRTPAQVRLVLIDPKQVELQIYADIPHLLCPVVTDMKRAPFVLEWAVRQMDERLHLFKMAGVRNVADYNALGTAGLKRALGDEYDAEEFPDELAYYVVVIDELADLMMVARKEVETSVARLAAKARASGIHLLVATQRPSTDVVTGLIKANLPVRMAFRVNTGIDSRVILDDGGAESLLGNGDFLYRPPGTASLVRGQGSFVSTSEVNAVCDHLREHGKPEYLDDLVQMKGGGAGGGQVDDPLYEDAVRVILQSGRGSASLLQRALSIGYTRASRLIDIMTEQGVLGPFVGSKAREVLLSPEEWEEQQQEA